MGVGGPCVEGVGSGAEQEWSPMAMGRTGGIGTTLPQGKLHPPPMWPVQPPMVSFLADLSLLSAVSEVEPPLLFTTPSWGRFPFLNSSCSWQNKPCSCTSLGLTGPGEFASLLCTRMRACPFTPFHKADGESMMHALNAVPSSLPPPCQISETEMIPHLHMERRESCANQGVEPIFLRIWGTELGAKYFHNWQKY